MKQLVEEYSNVKQPVSDLEKDNKNRTVDKKSNMNQLGSHLKKDNGNRVDDEKSNVKPVWFIFRKN